MAPAPEGTVDFEIRPGSGRMFDAIAGRYDLLNRLTSLGLDRAWRRHLATAAGPLAPGDRVLDLATGTGDVLEALRRQWPGVRVLGLDPSRAMLARARTRWPGVPLVGGDARHLPFPDGAFAACTMAFGIRNVPDRPAALRELARVTRPGGRVCILELGEPQRGLLAGPAAWYVHRAVPFLGGLLSGASEYRYLAASMAAFPAPEAFRELMAGAGLDAVAARPFLAGTVHLFTGVAGGG